MFSLEMLHKPTKLSFENPPVLFIEANIDKLGPVRAVDVSDAFADTLGIIRLSTPSILSNKFIVLLTQSQTNSSVIIPSLCILLKNSCCTAANCLAY